MPPWRVLYVTLTPPASACSRNGACKTYTFTHAAPMNRPKLPKKLRRVVLSARILPQTKAALAKSAKISGQSIGEIIDTIVRQYC